MRGRSQPGGRPSLPGQARSPNPRGSDSHSSRSAAMSLAFLFPGQGSQAVGMGQDLAGAFSAAREVFQEVDDALGQNLTKLMREGPEDQLTLTENAQPALMAVSVAAMRALAADFGVGVE